MSLINSSNSQRQKPIHLACLENDGDGQCESLSHNVGHTQPQSQHQHQFVDGDDPRSIRTYLVLLQDCLAIKFVPLASSTTTATATLPNHRNSLTFLFNNNDTINNNGRSSRNSNCYATIDSVLNGHGKSGGRGSRNGDGCCNQRQCNYNNVGAGDHQPLHALNASTSKSNGLSSTAAAAAARIIGPNLMTVNMINGNGTMTTTTSSSLLTDSSPSKSQSPSDEVDSSHHGLALYKNFREANLKCYWNATLYEAFLNLEYKGFVVPSTLLVYAIPRYLATLRTAWSRRILRSPPGFHIEFVGEIEELLADPVRQSQFAPLSDSLCWAILEITSMGQEAFVDSISSALTAAFPTMVLPAKERIYATLEKLIRERKVYQTSHGYFVVTPDTFRYMVSADPQPLYATLTQPTNSNNTNTNTLTLPLDALLSPPIQPQQPRRDPERINSSRNSWVSEVNEKNSSSVDNNGIELEPRGCGSQLLRRHNSMKIIRQKDASHSTMTAPSFMRDKTRSMSFRLYKSKSIPSNFKDEKKRLATMKKVEKLNKQMENLLKKDSAKNSGNKGDDPQEKTGKPSFFRKLFGRSTRKKSDKNVASTPSNSSKPSVSTQTPRLSELENSDSGNNSPSTPPIIPTIHAAPPRHFTLPNDLLSADDEITPSPIAFSSRCNSLPKRPSSRLSILNDEPHLYSTPTNPYGTNCGSNESEGVISAGKHARGFQIGGSSRCSTLSHGTSLGYGSQGPTSLMSCMSNQSCQSPSPSTSTSPSGIYSTLNQRASSTTHEHEHNGPSSDIANASATAHNQLPSRSSRGYGSYRNYYDYYRRRYPPYGSTSASATMQSLRQPASFASTLLSTATASGKNYSSSLNRERDEKPNQTQQQHQKEAACKTITRDTHTHSHNNNENGIISAVTSTTKSGKPFMSTTTTVTQNVKSTSTTNMELEFSLPLGKASLSTLQKVQSPAVKTMVGSGSDKVSVNMSSSSSFVQPHTKIIVGLGQLHPTSPSSNNETTEVKTTINHDGTIETHFNCGGSDPNARLGDSEKDTAVLVNGSESAVDQVRNSGVEIKLLDSPSTPVSETSPSKQAVTMISNGSDSPIKKPAASSPSSQPPVQLLQRNVEKVADVGGKISTRGTEAFNSASLCKDVLEMIAPKNTPTEYRCYNNGIVKVSDFVKSVETDFM